MIFLRISHLFRETFVLAHAKPFAPNITPPPREVLIFEARHVGLLLLRKNIQVCIVLLGSVKVAVLAVEMPYARNRS